MKRRNVTPLAISCVAMAAMTLASCGMGSTLAPSTAVDPAPDEVLREVGALETEQRQEVDALELGTTASDGACAPLCGHYARICGIAQRICELSERHPESRRAAESCAGASAVCRSAGEKLPPACPCAGHPEDEVPISEGADAGES